jgi:hypothetical protein
MLIPSQILAIFQKFGQNSRQQYADPLRVVIVYGNILKSMPFKWNSAQGSIYMAKHDKWLWYLNIGLDLCYRTFKTGYFISIWNQLSAFHAVVHLYVLSASFLMYCFVFNNLLKLDELIATTNNVLKMETQLASKSLTHIRELRNSPVTCYAKL